MITLENINFRYRESRRLVFQNLSISLGEGKIYGLLGKNGAGKSTLLYLMTGLLKANSGQIEFKGEDVSMRHPSTLREIFIVSEEFELPSISLKNYIKYNSPFYPNFSEVQMNKYLECFEMPSDINLGSLSMGQKKKVYMSFALATNTSVLVMDEPTNGLDIPSKSQFRKFIAMGMDENKTILISTHQVQDIDKMLDHVLIIDKSNILLNKSTNEICQKLRFVQSYEKADLEKAIYSIPSVQGNSMIMENTTGEETQINLEILFNATLNQPEKIASLF